jgi:hypothetical protein
VDTEIALRPLTSLAENYVGLPIAARQEAKLARG